MLVSRRGQLTDTSIPTFIFFSEKVVGIAPISALRKLISIGTIYLDPF